MLFIILIKLKIYKFTTQLNIFKNKDITKNFSQKKICYKTVNETKKKTIKCETV